MVNLGYQINNCADLVSWLIHTLGAEAVLCLIVNGAVFLLYLLYAITRLVDDGCRSFVKIIRSLCKNICGSLHSRLRTSTVRRRSSRSRSYPSTTARVSRCYDRPDCPIPVPPTPLHLPSLSDSTSVTPLAKPTTDLRSDDQFDLLALTPTTPLAPPRSQPTPIRRVRRNSLN